MGLLDKVKNIFTEEVEVEEKPVTKEVIKVEIPAPEPTKTVRKHNYDDEILKKEIIKNEVMSREEKKEEKTTVPVFFDDKDFATLEKPKEKPEKKKLSREKYRGSKNVQKEEKKVFKPTPIISPVYGILDKNYTKDEITDNRRTISHYESREVTIDDIRKKAYGTLEDEIETSIIKEEPKVENVVEEVTEEKDDMFEELMDMTDDSEKEEEKDNSDDIFNFDINNLVNEEPKEEDITESDLFDLIDSMYEKGENE